MRIAAGSLRVPMPRLLPLTILAMAALLAVKSVALVRAAAPATASEAPSVVKPPDAASAANPTKPAPGAGNSTDAKPTEAKPADAGPADAKANDAKAAPTTPPEVAASMLAPPAPPISESERTLLLDLRQRREELETREAALAGRESLLSAAEARLAARLAELGGLQKRLEALEAARHDHDEANWRGLVKLYESMKPKDAAAIFNDLDLPVLLPVLDRMKEQKAALVMAAMLPDRARLVTAELAQMRAHANAVPPPAPAAAGAAAQMTSPAKAAGGG